MFSFFNCFAVFAVAVDVVDNFLRIELGHDVKAVGQGAHNQGPLNLGYQNIEMTLSVTLSVAFFSYYFLLLSLYYYVLY